MKRLLTLTLICIVAIIIAALYGIAHDQLTYSISPEYYTRFKFIQFGFVDSEEFTVADPRTAAAAVGVLATWWMGIPIGLIVGLVTLAHPRQQDILRISLRALALVVAVAIMTGLIGLVIGFYQANNHLESYTSGWYIPNGVRHLKSFVAVGSMHNFSYIGGLLGLGAAVVYSIRKRRQVLGPTST